MRKLRMMGTSAEHERGVMGKKRRERGKPARSCIAFFHLFPSLPSPPFSSLINSNLRRPPPPQKKSDRERQGMREKCMESVSLKSNVLNIFCSAPKTELQTKISGINKCDILELLDG